MKQVEARQLLVEQIIGEKDGDEEFPWMRIRLLWASFLVVFLVIVARLFWLQVVRGSYHRTLSEENRILARSIPAPRGVILDRNRMVLSQNEPVYKLRNAECPMDQGTGSRAEECLELTTLSREEALLMTASGRGQEVVTLVGRRYRYGPEAAHLVGFVGEADEVELAANPELSLGETIGKMGVELVYDDRLRGGSGSELVEVDAAASVVRSIAKREPQPGEELSLSIDMRLQQLGYELLTGRVGAIVAADPQSGEVLALVSRPSFDPNAVAESLTRDDQPFFNRAIAGLYPPGSVFKVVTAVAGLQEGRLTEGTEIEDTGEIRIGPYRYGNWYFDQYGRTEGVLNLVGAIRRSNDIFFYKVGELVGATKLSEWAKAMGFGQRSGIDLPGEASGLVPSPLWKEMVQGERWFLGNTYHFAIGQSDLQVTPLQVTRMTAAVASGKLCRPLVVRGEGSCEELGVREENLLLVREGMRQACLSGGTAFPFFNFGVSVDGEFRRIEVGCKTGTAEYGDPRGRTHAWFTVFAPFADPKIVVTVLLEGAGEGSYQAAPVAKELLEYYFSEIEK